MRVVALTGVPGTGKTSVAQRLADQYPVVNVNDLADRVGALEDWDEDLGVHILDEDLLRDRARGALPDGSVVVVEGHLAHYADPDLVVVLRCRPQELERRLRQRDWSDAKVAQNVEAERLDAAAFEVDADEAYEVDTTGAEPDAIAGIVGSLVQGETVKHERVGGLGAFDHLEA